MIRTNKTNNNNNAADYESNNLQIKTNREGNHFIEQLSEIPESESMRDYPSSAGKLASPQKNK